MEILICQYKDPYKPVNLMECHEDFEGCSLSFRNYGNFCRDGVFFSYAQMVAYLPKEMVDDHISHEVFWKDAKNWKSLGFARQLRAC